MPGSAGHNIEHSVTTDDVKRIYAEHTADGPSQNFAIPKKDKRPAGWDPYLSTKVEVIALLQRQCPAPGPLLAVDGTPEDAEDHAYRQKVHNKTLNAEGERLVREAIGNPPPNSGVARKAVTK